MKALRRIALSHCRGNHPDLATLARELGSAVRCHAAGLDLLSGKLRAATAPLIRPLRTGAQDVQLLLIAWPANHVSVLHDHGVRWGLEIPLHGALEVEAWRRRGDSGEPLAHGRHWLGPGDALWFDAGQSRLHRCRNLSGREAALSLHLFGGARGAGLAYAQDTPSNQQRMHPPRPAIAGPLPG
ncbi:MAG: cysteine dioxygenase [Frateuria sp.]|uniref:cysteine dioxygenase n=1 Tax=Frateuria sp. TaxID=2211372 RepID=UPI00178EDB74|nr:cysteine dioxygenase [Frateuria sp.]NUO74064.1 cysteine dioxygenase [Frateuria sp.]NUR22350.1 cysteine dioxygenase [Frateuria sp.]